MILVDALLKQIGGTEWIIIILMGLFLLFGSKRLPGLSRTLGKAAGEYEKARDLFRKEIEQTAKTESEKTMRHMVPRITTAVMSEREKLEEIANTMGIDHIGKTNEQLRALISERMQDL
ncbi:MAG TPA: twin-arginine translocase TatA/TatE family subunit [Nitrososphaeraceae archaeon]|nr:twin-arginine translocase TatA/TatE family subunit [Nitrososphaeraceae archaeon]